mmetsp:Transcript_9410/g.13752  ORF Transcript_9410/g.13752 Transcript_9410/m.13752 type:complete len:815 (+) Transcript_9410:194-2638(+)
MEGSSDIDANLNPTQNVSSSNGIKKKKKKKSTQKKTKSIRSHALASSYTTAENITANTAHGNISSTNDDASLASKSYSTPISSSEQQKSNATPRSNKSHVALARADSLQKVEENIKQRNSNVSRSSAAARYASRKKKNEDNVKISEMNDFSGLTQNKNSNNVDTNKSISSGGSHPPSGGSQGYPMEERAQSVSSSKASINSSDTATWPKKHTQPSSSPLEQESNLAREQVCGPPEGIATASSAEREIAKDSLETGMISEPHYYEEENQEAAVVVVNNGIVSSTGDTATEFQDEFSPIALPSGQAPQESAICAEVHPDLEFGTQDVNQTAGIEAFVAEEAVEASGVAVVMSEEDERRLERRRMNTYKIVGIIVFVVLAIIVAVVVGTTVGGKGDDEAGDTELTAPTTSPPSYPPTFAPSSPRMQEWAKNLTIYSEEAAFNNRLSPQYLALRYISDDDALLTEVGSPRGVQRYLLACFYFALNGDNWAQCTRLDQVCSGDKEPWLRGKEDECNWFGIECEDSKVTSIFFRRSVGENLEGYLPPELGELSDLERIILQRNVLKGGIPTYLGKLKKLKKIIFRGNQFVGSIPEELMAGAKMLGVIDFAENQLTGTLSSKLSSLPIVSLNLEENNFKGVIPAALGKLTDMTKLDLSENQLTGMIPEDIYNATSMENFHLFQNKLNGTLSVNIGRLTNLETLQLGDNNISGTLPEELFTITTLSDISLENTHITGTLSSNISEMYEKLIKVDLSNNEMSGQLPSESIEKLTLLTELILHGNKFVGSITKAICEEKGLFLYDLQNLTVPKTVSCGCCNLQA